MKRLTIGLVAFAAILLADAAQARAALRVVATTQDLEAIVKEVAGDKAETESLAAHVRAVHRVDQIKISPHETVAAVHGVEAPAENFSRAAFQIVFCGFVCLRAAGIAPFRFCAR